MAGTGTKAPESRCQPLTTNQKEHAMTARQFLLSESSYCRKRAADCTDRYIAEELRRLAEQFERTADAIDSALRTKIATMPAEAWIQGFPPASGTGYN